MSGNTNLLRRAGWALALVLGAFLGGCGGGGGGGGASDIEITLSTAGGVTTLESGGTLVIRANVTNSATMEVTWTLNGATCPGACGTITSTTLDFATYAAPASVAAQFTVTVTATSTEDASRSGSVVLTVQPRTCPPGASLLDGQYAFLLQGFDQSRNGIAAVGSLTADACGGITGGTADYYFGTTVAGTATSLGGSYTMGADDRGTLSLTVGAATVSFAIAVGRIGNGVASRGAMTEMDPGALGGLVLSGSMWLQDPAAFALGGIAGPYAFVLNGWNGPGPREAMGGTVTADGAGGLAGGPLDDKVFGSAPVTTASWTGTYGAPSSSGRSAVTAQALTGSSGSAVMYVVDPGQAILLVRDTSGAGRVLSGNVLAQTGPFGPATLSGSCVTYQTANYHQPGYETLTTATLSLFSADGAGVLSMTSYHQNFGGNLGTGSNFQYTYTVDASGQATIYTPAPTVGGKWYMTGPNTGLMLGFDTGVSIGMILPQAAGPFSAASISGRYFGSQAPGASAYSTLSSGVATSAGAGELSTTMDVNLGGSITTGQVASGPIAVDSVGWGTDTHDNVIYVVSPGTFLMMNEVTFYPVIQVFER